MTSKSFALLEAPRALAELASIPLSLPLLSLTPRGDGHGVFIIPGLGATDRSTYLLRRFIESKGYKVSGWGMGRNLGIKNSGGAGQLIEMFQQFQQEVGGKVSLIGWSLGGVHARRIARAQNDLVRQVICLGSPINGSPTDTVEWNQGSDRHENTSQQQNYEEMQQFQFAPLALPSTSIYSKSDGVVPWKMSIETNATQADNIEVVASHIGLGVNPSVFYIIAKLLAKAESDWQPFDVDSLSNRLALTALNPLGKLFQSVVESNTAH